MCSRSFSKWRKSKQRMSKVHTAQIANPASCTDPNADERKKMVFEWCSKVVPYEKHRNAKSLRYPNTVMWFFDCPEYQKWAEESNSAIWLYGIRM